MTCQDTAESISALCDGERIPRDAAEHIGACEACKELLHAYALMGLEFRRIASMEEWEPKDTIWGTQRRPYTWWRKAGTNMKIPRIAFVSMLAAIIALSSGLALVRAREAVGQVFVLTATIPPDNATVRCAITSNDDSKTNYCHYGSRSASGTLDMDVRFIKKVGDRTQIGIKTLFQPQVDAPASDLKNAAEQTVWITAGNKQSITVPGVGEIALSGEYLDQAITVVAPSETDSSAKRSGVRIVSPVFLRNKELLAHLDGSMLFASTDTAPALMIYIPNEGRFIVSTAALPGGVPGTVSGNSISFSLDGQDYLLLTTASPFATSKEVWLTHDPKYKLSEHTTGVPKISDDNTLFMAKSLQELLQPRLQLY